MTGQGSLLAFATGCHWCKRKSRIDAISLLSALRHLFFYGLLGIAVCSPATAGLRVKLFSRPPQVAAGHWGLGNWRLTIATDAFSGDKTCRLDDRADRISYANGALGFHFEHQRRTMGAWERIDDEAATRSRDDLPELVRLGVAMSSADLGNPTDGAVWIPARRLETADHVWIQPGEGQRPRVFHLKGFIRLRDSARALGCTPEQRFVP